MKVYYRMTPQESKYEEERPVFEHDKYRLSEFCLQSFVKAFASVEPEMVFLLDRCPKKWVGMINRVVKYPKQIVELEGADQQSSYLVQLGMARELSDKELVWFQEDDYYYLPDRRTGEKLEWAVRELGFVSPYDHGEFYQIGSLHPVGPYQIRVVGDHHFRTVKFNTMTWGTTAGKIKRYWTELNKYGVWDLPTWEELRKKRVRLWSPIPTLATHMHREWLSPGVDWDEYFGRGMWVSERKNKSGMKLDLGSGNPAEGEIRPVGYVLNDIEPHPGIDLVCDIRELDKYVRPGQCKIIRASHVLEHFGRKEVEEILQKLQALLVPGGLLQIMVPNMAWHAQLLLAGREEEAELYAFGGQKDEYDFHQSGWTPELLKLRLVKAGFREIRICVASSLEARANK